VARTFIRAVLDEWHLAALEPDASLVASELVTNGHHHGGGSRWMRLSIEGDHLRIAVADRDRTRSPRRRMPSIKDEGGRGLTLVDAMADRWGTQKRRLRTGKIVWCELKI
jgi:two-component sensor histidine kinase